MSIYVISVKRKGHDYGYIYRKSKLHPVKEKGNVWVTKNPRLSRVFYSRANAEKYIEVLKMWKKLEFSVSLEKDVCEKHKISGIKPQPRRKSPQVRERMSDPFEGISFHCPRIHIY